ncbi:phosphatidate phosphatase PAH1-like isoform X1 [Zingiber officinale]|uniref:phosphatidate phosphatase PAH1-like isoform X1 n=1 Tax=Zingiber officinale TaxID=94328 RepID=UPI001C4D5E72|nr:phosphatidate phosphatase PAH1-like isoform X1 [Zingiber officinale]
MNVVGRVGSLISQGVYSVATPFHPFGGAVDVIVVRQEDGSYRSTPWYVRFGKFQGVLKGAEKVVTISVNGVEANFHMYLDNSGQAYFLREVVPGSDDAESSIHIISDLDTSNSRPTASFVNNADSLKTDYNSDKGDDVKTVEQLNGFQDEQTSPQSSSGSSVFSNYHYGSLDEVEDMVKESSDSNSEMVLISVDGHILTAPISSNQENTDNVQLDTPQFHLGPGKESTEEFVANEEVWESGLFGDLDETLKEKNASDHQLEALNELRQNDKETDKADDLSDMEEDAAGLMKNDTFKSCLDFSLHADDVDSQDVYFRSDPSETLMTKMEDSKKDIDAGHLSCSQRLLNEKIDTLNSKDKILGNETVHLEGTSNYVKHVNNEEHFHTIASDSTAEEECCTTENYVTEKKDAGLGFEISLCGNLLRPGMGHNSAKEVFQAHLISEDEYKASGMSIIKNVNLVVRYENKYFKWDNVAHLILRKAVFGCNVSMELKDCIPIEDEAITKSGEDTTGVSPSISRRWRLWPIPFRRSRSLQHSTSNSSNEDLYVDSEPGLQNSSVEKINNDDIKQSPRKQYLRTLIPTNEQIASLNLREGQNMIAFSFSTRVLGRQQVDAHIYLWKWNARIVISDVDGTITKSDVLGQFMPLVGRDWTQSGVAGLFSAIKENGYQLLFLSARAIVQAYLTRSFLLNLKQDGKALPNGPIVISPDGLFPSLYREVIRRAPHEFKIACLEDIKALFPADYNPFYAGFGNRDTDELSYRKIGIPKGKIFIINPKGEVAINHCVDVKSYTSLHTLVNDMFPSTSLVEQEEFNSWNYWRMPLMKID